MCPICFGGPFGYCPRVRSAFTLKELQQYRYYTTQLFIGQPGPSYHQFLEKLETVAIVHPDGR